MILIFVSVFFWCYLQLFNTSGIVFEGANRSFSSSNFSSNNFSSSNVSSSNFSESNFSTQLNISEIFDKILTEEVDEKPSTTTTTQTPRPPFMGCKVESFPNGVTLKRWTSIVLSPGESAYLESIRFKCLEGYQRVGQFSFFCTDYDSKIPYPQCIRTCRTKSLTGHTIRTNCELDGMKRPCDRLKQHMPGTQVSVSCAEGYRKPKGDFPEELICNDDGEWSQLPTNCEQECGVISEPEAANNSVYLAPWHVAVYKKTPTTWYEEFCAGVVLSANLVISVAHCFWDKETATTINLDDMQIAVGKYNALFSENTAEYPAITVASEIHIPQTYKDEGSDDIALLVMRFPLILRKNIVPICLDFTDQGIDLNLVGRIAGRGVKNDCNIFDVVDIEIGHTSCILQPRNLEEIEFSKQHICVTGIGSICVKDGAGVAVARMVNGVKTYFLFGIINSFIDADYVAMTLPEKHANLITQYYNRTYIKT